MSVNNQYVSVTNGTFMFLTKKEINVVVQKNAQKVDQHSFYLVNRTGQDILETVDGTMTLDDLSRTFCAMKNISHEDNTGWINEFVSDMASYGALEFCEQMMPHEKIRVAGKDTIISPLTVTVEVTERCNLRCKHCYLEACPEKSNTISIENFRRLVSMLKKNNVVNIELTGGEFFVHPDAYDILELSFQNFAIVALLTNGTILDNRSLDLLKRNKNRVVLNVSVDSVTASIHDEFRCSKGAFERTCDNIKRLTDNGIVVRMASSISTVNMWEVDKLADLSRELGASQFAFNHIENIGRGATLEEANLDLKDETLRYVKYLNEVMVENKDIVPFVDQDEYLLGTHNCGAGVKKIVIGPDGELRPCVLYPHHSGFGNVFENEYADLFQQKIFSDIADIEAPGVEGGCDPTCKYLHHCKGCYIKALEHNVTLGEPCSWITENKLEWLLAFYSGVNESCSVQA